MRAPQELLEQAITMHDILSQGPPTEYTPEILSRLQARVTSLELCEVIRIYRSLDACGVPEDSNIRKFCGKALIAQMVKMGQQIPTPATT